MGRALTLAAIGAVLEVSTPAHAQNAEVQQYLNAAVTLYENLEYEKALQQLQRAKTKSTRASDDSRIALYEGIIWADLGKEEQALSAFKTGLSLEPEAKLPLEVAPKVERVFTRAQQSVQKLLGPQLEQQREEARARAAAEKRRAQEEQRHKDEEARLAAEKAAESSHPPPSVAAAPAPGPSLRRLGLIPLAVGVASGALATYFLLGAKSREDSLYAGTAPPADAVGVRETGKTYATLGYVFTGLAAAGAATAVVMFLVGGNNSGTQLSVCAGPGELIVGLGGTLP